MADVPDTVLASLWAGLRSTAADPASALQPSNHKLFQNLRTFGEEEQPIIVGPGTFSFKVGFGGESRPRESVPTVVGRPRFGKAETPVGLITNWDDVEKLLHHSFYKELQVAPEERPVYWVQSPQTPASHSEKITQILFETFNVPAAQLMTTPEASLVAAGQFTGMVVDLGAGDTPLSTAIDGEVTRTFLLGIGGRDLDDQMMKLLACRGYQLVTSAERESLRQLKEAHCYVAQDLYEDLAIAQKSAALQKSFTLPSNDIITFAEERFQCPEILFQPSMIGMSAHGLHMSIYELGWRCPAERRPEVYGTILLVGGGSLLPGLQQRLMADVNHQLGPKIPARVVSLPERANLAWLGASISSTLSCAEELWISKDRYDEIGPALGSKEQYLPRLKQIFDRTK